MGCQCFGNCMLIFGISSTMFYSCSKCKLIMSENYGIGIDMFVSEFQLNKMA